MTSRDAQEAARRLIHSLPSNDNNNESTIITTREQQIALAERVLSSQLGEGMAADRLEESWGKFAFANKNDAAAARTSLRNLRSLHPDDNFPQRLLQVFAHHATENTAGKIPPTSTKTVHPTGNGTGFSHDDEEQALLRECLYALQGIDGDRLKYVWKHLVHPSVRTQVYEGIRFRSNGVLGDEAKGGMPPNQLRHSRLGAGAEDAICICGEAGWLYSRIFNYCQLPSRGSIDRAFREALQKELEQYQAFLAQLRNDSDRISLRGYVAELRKPLARLHVIALVVESVPHCHGSDLLSALYEHSIHGDLRHAECVQSLLRQACRPWYRMLSQWSNEGVLDDAAADEFCISFTDVGAPLLWREGFQLARDKVPKGSRFLDLVDPIFSLGKGINYIRKCLLDSEWELPLNDDNDAMLTCEEDDSLVVEQKLKKANTSVHRHILDRLHGGYHLFSHLFALKQFLLLGQGDFFASLMDGLYQEYEHQVGIVGIYRHSLAGLLDWALKSSNANDFPDFVLERLQVNLRLDEDDHTIGKFGEAPEESGEDKRTVWDIFALQYVVPDPLVAIVPKRAQLDYQDCFQFLFELRRIEFFLNQTWRQSAILQHALHTVAQYNAIKVSTSEAYSQATRLLRQIAITRQAMMHFVFNLKSYLMFEVLEGGWKTLVQSIQQAETLDEIVEGHDRYLACIMMKSMQKDPQLRAQLSQLFQLCFEFCGYQRELFGEAQSAVDRSSAKRQEAEERLTRGDWGIKSESEMLDEETFFGLSDASNLAEVDRISDRFTEEIVRLLADLDTKLNGTVSVDGGISTPKPSSQTYAQLSDDDDVGDLDALRSLTLQLDHNNFYRPSTSTVAM